MMYEVRFNCMVEGRLWLDAKDVKTALKDADDYLQTKIYGLSDSNTDMERILVTAGIAENGKDEKQRMAEEAWDETMKRIESVKAHEQI